MRMIRVLILPIPRNRNLHEHVQMRIRPDKQAGSDVAFGISRTRQVQGGVK